MDITRFDTLISLGLTPKNLHVHRFFPPQGWMCIVFFSSGLDVHRFFLLMAQKASCASIFPFGGPKSFTCIDFPFWWPKKFHVHRFFLLMAQKVSCASIFLFWWLHVHRFFCADDLMCIDFCVDDLMCIDFLCWWPHVHRFFVLMTWCALIFLRLMAWKNHVHRFYCWILIF